MRSLRTHGVAAMLAVLLGVAPGWAAEAAPSGKVPIFPVDEIKAGMQGVAYSVFQGTEPEEFPVEVVGVLKNVWGPRQHIILVRVGGKPAKTGVAAGMSGSPVYIDGKWVGAISLRIGMFPTEPLAGVTPAESMLEIEDSGAAAPVAAVLRPIWGAASETRGPREPQKPQDAFLDAIAPFLPASFRASGPAPGYLTPIETPLALSGFSDSVLELFAPVFQRMGVVAVQGGSEAASGEMPSSEELASALPPGSAVAGMLVTGDITMAGTGTVAYNDGQRVLAFGHQFFGFGPVEMPMSEAEIVTTLGSSLYPFKIANSTRIVGSIRQDRHSGILGVLGQPARMIPVTAKLRGRDQSATYRYQVFRNPTWTPLVMLISIFNTLYQSNLVTAETSFQVSGAIHLAGYPPVALDSMLANAAGQPLPPGFAPALWLSRRFNSVFQNPFEQPEITSVELAIDLIPEVRSATIESVWGAAREVHPGDELPVKIFLRHYRGERVEKDALVRIPHSAPKGRLRLVFSDAQTLSQTHERLPMQQLRATSLAGLISVLNREPSNQAIHVTLLEPSPTAFYEDKLLPSIPSTIANVMDTARATSRMTVVGETIVDQFSVPADVVVNGMQTLEITVN